MVKLMVAYGPPEDPAAFDRYYADTAAMATPEGQAAAGDIPNFASGGATLMIVEA